MVGIGASAGGLEALEPFIAAIEPKSNLAYVVVTHLAPDRPSLLPELLQRHSRVEVVIAADGMKLSPNRIHVSPPGCCLEVTDDRLGLLPADRFGTIDHFFKSLARNDGAAAIGVVLSGPGSDGTLGIQDIKNAGGLVFAQDPDTAKYPGMPRSAIATDAVDYVLAPDKMPQQLVRSTGGRRVPAPGALSVEDPRGGVWVDRVLALLDRRRKHDFGSYKRSTVNRRIERRMTVHGFTSIRDYARFVEKNPYELDSLFADLLIGVTSFFRDAEAFMALERELEQVIRSRTDEAPIRVWVPGCSNGAEAYSIAILIKEILERTGKNFGVQIFATDIDTKAIETARGGRYPESISSSVGPERLEQFFTREEDGFRVKKEIRELLVFAVQDVIKDPPFTKLDLLSCRNLLIYFDGELQRHVLGLFCYSINLGGLLFLGSSESLGVFEERFIHLDKKGKLFRIRETAPRAFPEVQLGRRWAAPSDHHEDPPHSSRPNPAGVTPAAERALLASHVPPSAIVSDRGELIYLHGRTGPFLEPSPGEPSNNVFHMAREGLRLEIPAAVRRAAKQAGPVVRAGLRVKTNGGYSSTRLTVRKLTEPDALRDAFVLTFEIEQDGAPPDTKTGARRARREQSGTDELELELQVTKEALQGTIEEFESSSEELKSANQELQSTNEELETSREELQSLNEELQTVNAEGEERNRRVSQLKDDMRNLLNSTEIATVFLDGRLLVRRFTPPATKVFGLIEADIGRPLAHFAINLRFDGLMEDAAEVLRTLVRREREIQTKEGEWRLLRILPYRTEENAIDGLVMTFVDIDRVKRAEEAAQGARAHAEAIVEALPGALLVLDEKLMVVSATKAFHDLFRTTARALHGEHFAQLAAGAWQRPDFVEQLKHVVDSGDVITSFDLGSNFPRVGINGLTLTARRMNMETTRTALVLITVSSPAQEKR